MVLSTVLSIRRIEKIIISGTNSCTVAPVLCE
jgi:hypothetical protein